MGKKTVRIPLDEALLEDLDARARQEGRSRAEVVQEACRAYVNVPDRPANRVRTLDSPEYVEMFRQTRELADRALATYGEPTMSLEELQHALDESLGDISLSDEILRQREAGW